MDGIMIYGSAFEICAAYDTDTQCRLVGYMARYALTGEEPDLADGDPARYIWPAIREKADRIIEAYEKKAAAGKQGGSTTQAQAKQKASTTQAEVKQSTSTSEAEQKHNASRSEADAKQSASSTQAQTKPDTDTDTEYDTDTERDTNARTRTREEAKVQLARFEKFWQAYPRHTDKQRAVKAWGKIRPDDTLLDRMLAAIAQQKQSDQWTRDGGAYIPHPSTWLTQQRWLDEMPKAVPRQGKTVIAQQYAQRDYSQEPPDDPPGWMMARWQEMQKGGETA